jgi:hypothetical protein
LHNDYLFHPIARAPFYNVFRQVISRPHIVAPRDNMEETVVPVVIFRFNYHCNVYHNNTETNNI